MRNERKRTQELELLSAYLDGELRPAERQALAARLQHEPDLGERLEQLRRTKIMVGYLPRLHAPRNYTLTPEMVTVRPQKKQPFISSLRLASALAAILLVVLFGAEFLLTSGPLARPQMAAKPMMEEAVMVMDDAEPEPLIVWGHPGVGGGADMPVEGRGGDAPVLMEAPVMVESMPVEDAVEVAVEEAPAAEPQEELLPEEEPELMVGAEALPAAEAEVDTVRMAPDVEIDQLILGINIEEGGEIVSRSTDSLIIEPVQPAWRTAVRVLQIALAVIAVGGGLAWWLLRRSA